MWFRSFTKVLHAFPIPLGNVEFRYMYTNGPDPTINFNRLCSLSWTNKRASMFSCAVLLLARSVPFVSPYMHMPTFSPVGSFPVGGTPIVLRSGGSTVLRVYTGINSTSHNVAPGQMLVGDDPAALLRALADVEASRLPDIVVLQWGQHPGPCFSVEELALAKFCLERDVTVIHEGLCMGVSAPAQQHALRRLSHEYGVDEAAVRARVVLQMGHAVHSMPAAALPALQMTLKAFQVAQVTASKWLAVGGVLGKPNTLSAWNSVQGNFEEGTLRRGMALEKLLQGQAAPADLRGYCVGAWKYPCQAVVLLAKAELDPCEAMVAASPDQLALPSQLHRIIWTAALRAAPRVEIVDSSTFLPSIGSIAEHAKGQLLRFRLAVVGGGPHAGTGATSSHQADKVLMDDSVYQLSAASPFRSDYDRVVRRLGRRVGAALSDPAQSAPMFNGTGPGNSHKVGLRSTRGTGIDWADFKSMPKSEEVSYLADLRSVIEEFIEPHASRSIFGGRPVVTRRVVLARNQYMADETFLSRAYLWHYDGGSEEAIKVMVYLNDVTPSSGCMMVMAHEASGAPFRVRWVDKVWGRHLAPVSVPKPWIREVLHRGFRPRCIAGSAGTTIFFHTNIVHRATAPHPGRHRDILLLELWLRDPPIPRELLAPYSWGEPTSQANQPRRQATTTGAAAREVAHEIEGLRPVQRPPHLEGLLTDGLWSVPVMGTLRRMPMLGFGTANRKSAVGKMLIQSLTAYLREGGRLIDTAQMYGNYAEVSQALQVLGVARSQVWIMSKVNTNKGKVFALPRDNELKGWVNTSQGALRATIDGQRMLGLKDGIDVMLIHGPFAHTDAELVEVWRGLLDARSRGHAKVVGVSNFDRRRIELLEAATGELPAVNQLEYHPWATAEARSLVEWCLSRRIVVVAYGSLGGSQNRAASDAAKAIAAKHGVSNAQILLRWAVDQGIAVIPGATSADHIRDNLHLRNFTLDADDQAALLSSNMPRRFRVTQPYIHAG